MRWTKGLLVPDRVRLGATAGPAGARAASILYRQYRHAGLARVLAKARTMAFTKGLNPACRPPLDNFADLCDVIGVAPDGAAAIQSSISDRQVFCLVAQELTLVVKVGSRTDDGLANEARLLQMLAGTAGSREVPSVRWSGHWSERLVVTAEVLHTADHSHWEFRSAMLAALHHHDAAPWSPARSAGRAASGSDQLGAPLR